MGTPHIYSSYEIAHAVNVGWGVDDHLRDGQFVKLKDYDEMASQKGVVGVFFSEDGEDNRSLRQRIDQLERENAELSAQLTKTIQDREEWIPCAVRLPERCEYVIVLGSQGREVRCWDTMDETDDYDGRDISFDAWFKETQFDGDPYFWIDFDEVKYWMPLPKEPDEENQKSEGLNELL